MINKIKSIKKHYYYYKPEKIQAKKNYYAKLIMSLWFIMTGQLHIFNF